MSLTDAERARREARKFGTDTPGEPTDEFVRNAFAEGAKSLWPDSRDPGWHVTFDRWLARHVAAAVQATTERVEALCDTATGRGLVHVDDIRAALAGSTDPTPDTRIKAEALREAADDLYGDERAAGPYSHPLSVGDWLRARADALDPTHHDKAVES